MLSTASVNGFVVRGFESGDAAITEVLVRDAFWDVYRPGCHEHLLWHRLLGGHPDLLLNLALVAEVDGRAVGCVVSTRASVVNDAGHRTPVVAVGPLAVDPAWQRRGIGGVLMRETLDRARADGERAAFLYGSPAYYPRFGFEDAARFGVTTAEGDNFPAFMALELVPGGLDGVSGRLLESSAFEVDEAEVDAFDARFPPRAAGQPG